MNAVPTIRLRHLAKRVHALGPRPLYELLKELAAGADPLETVETYAALDPDVVHALGADDFPPPFVAASQLEEWEGRSDAVTF